MSDYTIKRKVETSFETTIEKLKDELKEEGFGVLTEIDLKETFKNKLDEDFNKYNIMGACNPHFAFEGFQSEEDLGVLLPCNVVVYENDADETIVAAIDPVKLLSFSDEEEINRLGEKIKKRFEKVIKNL